MLEENGTIYQIENQQKKGFASAEVFLGLGYKFENVFSANLVDVPFAKLIDNSDQAHSNGIFVIDQEGRVWYLEQGQRRPVPNPQTLFSYNLTFDQLIPANQADLNLPEGATLGFNSGSLINDQGTVWIVSENNKSSFDSAECFLSFGFNFAQLYIGSTEQLQTNKSACTPPPDNSLTYVKKTVSVNGTNFTVHLLTVDTQKVEFITDTAADNECSANCPGAPVKTYAEVHNARAAINGTYFCTASDSNCWTNTYSWKVFDTKLGRMINEADSFTRNEPFIAQMEDKSLRFFDHYSDYNTQQKIIAGINHQPLLVKNGQFAVDYNKLDRKQVNEKYSRGAIGFKGSTIYAMIGLNMTIPDSARVMQALGAEYALALDGGGTSALFFDGEYKIGPGRNTPNAIIFK
ncbi:MAG: phosphodiester glycosidase family protein [Candidatus Doudnabacteria bacterium]